MDLAAVEKIRGNDDAQIDALVRALRPRADNGDASRLLAAAHRRAGRFAEARAVLEQAIAAAPLDVANRGALAETLWAEDRQQNGVRAVEILTDALRREPGYSWGWDALERYATALGQPARLEAAARLLTSTRPGEARSWLRLAQMLPGETGPALTERLEALDRVLALNPRCDDAYDLRAVLLASAGRFDEALAACEPSEEAFPGGTRPFTLEGRAAWVLARRGDLSGARDRMRALLADQPGYEWGWRLLADWAEAAGDQTEALAAAERLAFLAPHAAGPLGYLAAARLQMGQRAEAKRDLLEAMRRDPSYLYAPTTLLQAQMDDKEFDDAEQTLVFLEKHHPGPLTLSRAVLLAARVKEPQRAAQALAELVLRQPPPSGGDGGLREAVDAMAAAGWHEAAEAALLKGVRAPEGAGHPDAGALWVRTRAGRKGGWKGLEKDVRGLGGTEIARRTRIAYLSVIAERRQGHRLPGFLRRARQELRADTESWGEAGYALVSCRAYGRANRWMTDWRERPGVESWMLFNLSISLRELGRHHAALEVNRHALTLPPDHTRLRAAAWVMIEDAISEGDEPRRRAELLWRETQSRAEEKGQPFRYLGALAGGVLTIRREEDQRERRTLWRGVRRTLRKERREAAIALRGSPALRRAEYRARRRMARDAGAWWVWMALWLFAPPQTDMPLKLASFLCFWIFGVGALIVGAIVLAGYLGLL